MLTQTFQFNDKDLIIHEDLRGDLWFRGTNVCEILGYGNPVRTLKTHIPDMIQELAIGEGRPAYYIAEKGLYILAFRAKTPSALEFQLWAADVIKNIRKTGSYTAAEADQKHFSPFGLKINLQGAVDAHSKALEGSNASLISETRRSLDMLYKMQQSDQGHKPKSAPSGSPLELNQKILTRIQNLNTAGTPATVRKILHGKHFQKYKIPPDTLRNALQILTTTGKVAYEEDSKAYTVVTPSEAS